MKVDNWKPGRPKFEVIPPDKDWLYQEIINDMKCGYEKEYERYLRQLERGGQNHPDSTVRWSQLKQDTCQNHPEKRKDCHLLRSYWFAVNSE